MTKVEVVNLAIAKLGGSLVVTLGDSSIPGSHFGGLLYQPTLDQVLRTFPWEFATDEAALALTGATPESPHWNFTYLLPARCVRLRAILGPRPELPVDRFARRRRKIHCDVEGARASFVANDLAPDELDPDFLEAFVTLLASKLATPLLQDPRLAAAMLDHYETTALPVAKTHDARESASGENAGTARAIMTSPLVQSRLGGGMGQRAGYGDLPMPE